MKAEENWLEEQRGIMRWRALDKIESIEALDGIYVLNIQ